MQQLQVFENFDPGIMTICCVPNLCHVGDPIMLDDLSDAVKVICNNIGCSEGNFMHKICFEQWEYTVLTYLRSAGRARSWSEKQRLQNLWNKKGYDLAYKACTCKCGKGHLRKDLHWIAPPKRIPDPIKKKKNRKKKNDKPSLSVTGNATAAARLPMSTFRDVPVNRFRSSSLSSQSSTSGSPPMTSSGTVIADHLHPLCSKFDFSNTAYSSKFEDGVSMFKESACARRSCLKNSIFCRRQDFSSFNSLPPDKINSYHIKMDNESDFYDERAFILPTLCARKIVGVACIFCGNNMIVFDRYPLIDGTFFISPMQYSNVSILMYSKDEVVRSPKYLNAICMACLEGWSTVLMCRFCGSRWNGSPLILGTVYSYDVIAAVPCCEERLKCNNCHVVLPQFKVHFYSDYSRRFFCPNCHFDDYHFIKPTSAFMLQSGTRRYGVP